MSARLLDHVGLVGGALPPLVDAWRRLGFAPTAPRPLMGRDPASGAAVPLEQWSAHVVLEGGYVELTAVGGDDPAHHLAPWRHRYEGLHILAFGADDAEAWRARGRAAGLPVTALHAASRAIEYGRRHGEARFRWFMLEASASPEALVCVVRHETPDLVFQPEVQWQPNGVRTLEGATLVVADPAAAAARLGALLGVAAADDGPGRLRFDLEGERLELLTPAAFAAEWGAPPPVVPWFGALAFGVADLAHLVALHAAAGIPGAAAPPGRHRVPPVAAGGAWLEFRPAADPRH